jgi:hypothetical protein
MECNNETTVLYTTSMNADNLLNCRKLEQLVTLQNCTGMQDSSWARCTQMEGHWWRRKKKYYTTVLLLHATYTICIYYMHTVMGGIVLSCKNTDMPEIVLDTNCTRTVKRKLNLHTGTKYYTVVQIMTDVSHNTFMWHIFIITVFWDEIM